MLKLILTFLAVYTASAQKQPSCRTVGSKELYTFSDTKEAIKMPCKFNAIRDSVCGKYSVTITPGNEYDKATHRYVLSGMWVRVEDIETGLRYEGRTEYLILRKWIIGYSSGEYPLMQKDGSADFTDFFAPSNKIDARKVVIRAKNGDFTLQISLYDTSVPQTYRDSGFIFTCNSDKFKPSAFPDQICGNGTLNEVFEYKTLMKYNSRDTTILVNVFNNTGIEQTDRDCQAASNALSRKSCHGRRYKVANLCGPIFESEGLMKCLVKGGFELRAVFRHCVEFHCTLRKDTNARKELSKYSRVCNQLKRVLDYKFNTQKDKAKLSSGKKASKKTSKKASKKASEHVKA